MNKFYFKGAFVGVFLCVSIGLYSQNIGINRNGATPSINAVLDLNTGNSGNLGLILPNVKITALNQFNPPIANNPTAGNVGMMVYNTNAAVGSGVGYYYWNGTTWGYMGGAASAGGNLNACGLAAANYISYFTSGTYICNSVIYQGPITPLVGIGLTNPVTNPPLNMLDVNGGIAIGSYAGTNTVPSGASLIVSGQTGIGTNSPSSSALLDMTSTTQGFLAPRLTTGQILLMPNLAVGLIVYNTTTDCYEYNYNATATGWVSIACPCSVAPTVGAISGPPVICAGTTGTYSVATVAGATYYSWSSANTNIAYLSSGNAGNGGTSAIFTGGATTGTVVITVTASNVCGFSTSNLSIYNGPPGNGNTPVGPTSPSTSASTTYTCAPVANATSSAWSVSNTANASIASGQGTNTVSIAFGATASAESICVTPSNACGSGTPACLSVTSQPCPSTTTVTTYSWSGTIASYNGPATIPTFTVPACATSMTVTVTGGGGINFSQGSACGTTRIAGEGAKLTGVITLTPGDILKFMVGGGGTDPECCAQGAGCYGSSGGGGSYIWDATTNTLLVAAGGGGGAGTSGAGYNGQTSLTNLTALETPNGGATNGAGGTGGGASSAGTIGTGGTKYGGAGGAGWGENFTTALWTTTSYDPQSATTPGQGGPGSSSHNGFGGYGGGGGGAFNSGGGGGGYNGGGGGNGNSGSTGGGGGGGGSYWQPSNFPPTSATVATGTTTGTTGPDGSITITYY